MKFSKIVIVDFGSQYTLLIAKLIRRHRVYSEVIPSSALPQYLLDHQDSTYGIILSGGPRTASQDLEAQVMLRSIIRNKNQLPILGICFGAQLLAYLYGSVIKSSAEGEFGDRSLTVDQPENDLYVNIPEEYQVWQSHADSIYPSADPNNDQINIISQHQGRIEAFQIKNRPFYGLQYHPEVTHTPEGSIILENFLRICQVPRDWSSVNFIEQIVPELQEQLKSDTNERVMVACSGGVDSTVTAALIQRAVGNRMMGIFVDPGLLRLDEYQQVLQGYQKTNLNVIGIDARQRFYSALKGVTDPEQKRKVIGGLFIDIFKEHAPNATWLGQGTIYPDVIESHGNIKSHHNVGGLPEKLNLKLIEPLRHLFKDDVRDLGQLLGIDPIILNRHPFPGPGLAIRILGEVTEEKVNILQRADHIFLELLKEHGHYDNIWQAGVILLNSKSVGVQGDNRTYQYVAALRAVESTNAMTASVYDFNTRFLTLVSTEIINQVSQINRVAYDVTTKPPGTIEWE